MTTSLAEPAHRCRSRPFRLSGRVPYTSVSENVILDELGTALGALLWRSARAVTMWAQTPPMERHDLFSGGAYEHRVADLLEIDPPLQLKEACEGLSDLLARPGLIQADHVAGHCVSVGSWARAQLKPGTTLVFFHAAASCCPFNPALALMAGREARDQAKHCIAERWLDLAVEVSRRGGNWEIYGRSHLAQANMLLARGALPAARRHATRAQRRAERAGLGDVLAMAHHDLFVIAAECGDHPAAHENIRAAMNTYGSGHPRLVNVAFDVAVFWMRQGYFEVVLPIYRTLLPRVEPRFLPHIHGAIARAAGACGLHSEHRQAVRALQATPVGPGTAEAWLDAAHGAVNLCIWSDAADYLERTLEIAQQRGERKIEFLSESLLLRVRSRTHLPGPALQEPDDVGALDLASDLIGLLPRVTAGSAS